MTIRLNAPKVNIAIEKYFFVRPPMDLPKKPNLNN